MLSKVNIINVIFMSVLTQVYQNERYSKIGNRIYYEELTVLSTHAFKDYYIYSMDREADILIEGTNLTTIEPEAFLNVKINVIEIVHNELESLTKGMFMNVSVIQFFLNNNKIKSIEAGTFNDIHPYDRHGVFILTLYGNRLTSIRRGVFNKLQVNTLLLQDNRINFILKRSFKDMPKLKYLDLSGNLLETVGVGIFQNLGDSVTLKLSKNRINFIKSNAFNDNTNLQLYLSSNKINITKKYFTNYADITEFIV